MNTLDEFAYWLEELPLSWAIGGTWLFPFIESLHVIGAVFVLGSIVIVDLRLLGLFARSQPFNALLRESLIWTWLAFVLAFVTGVGMFITRAGGYIHNPAFLWKMALLVLAGVNMLYFHRRLLPGLQTYQPHRIESTPLFQCRAAGAVSLGLWLGIMLAGRWVGHIL